MRQKSVKYRVNLETEPSSVWEEDKGIQHINFKNVFNVSQGR